MKTLLLLPSAGLGLLVALLPTFAFAQNYFAGQDAGKSNTDGVNNSFVGYKAGFSNTTGYNNSFVGSFAGVSNTTGNHNSFVGYRAGLSNTTGKGNSFVGALTGHSNTTGHSNSFLGVSAGYSNTDGVNNSFVGHSAGHSNTTGHSNSFLGMDAGYNNTTAARNSFFGTLAGSKTTTGPDNVFLGYKSGETNVTGSFNASLGNFSGPCKDNLSNATALGYRASVSISNALVLGSIKGVNEATASTQVGIGTTAPAYDLHLNGTAGKPGGGNWVVPSDEQLKKDITDFKDGLAIVQKINPVWFSYNGKAGLPTQKKYVGVIAQEMQKIAPYTVGEFVYQDCTGKQEKYLDYDANALTYILVNSVKEQQKQLKEQQQLNQLQEARITALESKLAEVDVLKQEVAVLKALLLQQPADSTAVGEAAQLWQNEPNPSDGSTVIRYFIPLKATSAQLQFFSTTRTGQPVQSFDLSTRGEGRLTVTVGQLPADTYIYHLLVDGKSVAAKRLIMQNILGDF